MKSVLAGAAAVAIISTGVAGQAPATGGLGAVDFPTSASAAAQASFLVGVKALFNFEFDTAAEAFQQTQKVDPGGPDDRRASRVCAFSADLFQAGNRDGHA